MLCAPFPVHQIKTVLSGEWVEYGSVKKLVLGKCFWGTQSLKEL